MCKIKSIKKVFLVAFSIIAFASCSPQAGAANEIPETTTTAGVPTCIKNLIKDFEKEPKQNPPRKVIQYLYEGKTVYYIPAICCDFYSDVYDANCKLIGHPDGGFTGKGDGTIVDFSSKAKEEKIIWEDKR